MKPYTQSQDDVFTPVRLFLESILSQLSSSDLPLQQQEVLLQTLGFVLFRMILQALQDLRSAAEIPAPSLRGQDGLLRTEHKDSLRSVLTTFGTIHVSRISYAARTLSSLHPLDAKLQLPADSFSYSLRFRVAFSAVRCSFEETIEEIQRHTGATVGKRQAELLCVRMAQDVSDFYQKRSSHPWPRNQEEEECPVLVLSFDGKGIPMHTIDLREETREKAMKKERSDRPSSAAEKNNRKRMAQVAAVYEVGRYNRSVWQFLGVVKNDANTDDCRPKPKRKRVWASVKRDPSAVMDEAFCEAKARDPEYKKVWVVLVDGSNAQLEAIRKRAKQEQNAPKIVYILDFIHVSEYIWSAASALFPGKNVEAQGWAEKRIQEVLQGKACQVAARMEQTATRMGLRGSRKEAVERSASYICKHEGMMDYEKWLEQGLPIATGVIEGTCRYLVKDRMERTGARWRLVTAEAILQLRSVWASGDWDAYCQFHLRKEFERNHLSKFHPQEHHRFAA